jgi:hypothetical protein
MHSVPDQYAQLVPADRLNFTCAHCTNLARQRPDCTTQATQQQQHLPNPTMLNSNPNKTVCLPSAHPRSPACTAFWLHSFTWACPWATPGA